MKNKLSITPNFHSGTCLLGFLILCLTYPIQGTTGEFDTYRYKLEQNNNDKVCSHMAGVFSKYFKKPFNTINDEAEYVKDGGIQPPLLPGAKNDLRSFVTMSFSFQPTSPEFDAIKWRVGKQIQPGSGQNHDVYPNIPFIAADIDINNDGQIKTFIKHGFMSCYLGYGGACNSGDSWSIFRKGDIDLMQGPIEWDVPIQGQNGHPPLAVILENLACNIVRPFIYDGVTYLSCYNRKLNSVRDYRKGTPHREYTDVLKYQGIEKLPDGRTLLKAETVCRFRMIVTK
ncbi:hypothetical protein GALL_99840 [mine drainage metagenome]|uniref:Uncharacterized protein n=1 Tax=mine drainage metagenome TaxID=410659 RepID=A0A1J5T6F8_9ZZZZ